MNKPYVKEYNEKGEVINPITKYTPYLHMYPNRKSRRDMMFPKKRHNNRNKNTVIEVRDGVAHVSAYKLSEQFINGKRILHYHLKK